MIIRSAKPSDADRIVEFCSKGISENEFYREVPVSNQNLSDYVRWFIEDGGDKKSIVADDSGELIGCMGLHVFPYWYNRDFKQVHESYWFVDPDRRSSGAGIRLLQEAESLSAASGFDYLIVSQPRTMPILGRLLERRGYSPYQSRFAKGLKL